MGRVGWMACVNAALLFVNLVCSVANEAGIARLMAALPQSIATLIAGIINYRYWITLYGNICSTIDAMLGPRIEPIRSDARPCLSRRRKPFEVEHAPVQPQERDVQVFRGYRPDAMPLYKDRDRLRILVVNL